MREEELMIADANLEEEEGVSLARGEVKIDFGFLILNVKRKRAKKG